MKKITFPATILLTLFETVIAFTQTTQPILRLNTEMHTVKIHRISTDSQGKYILTCSDDKTAKLWDASTGSLIRTFRPPIDIDNEGMLYACAISPNGKIASMGGFTGYYSGTFCIYIFNTETGELMQRITQLDNVITDLEFSMNGKYLAAAMGSNGVYIYEWSEILAKFETLSKLDDYDGTINNLCFDKSGRLATVCMDGYLRLYDKNFNKISEVQTSGDKGKYSLAFSPDGRKIAVGCGDTRDIDVYDGNSLALLYKPNISGTKNIKYRIDKVTFSSDGKYLFGGGGIYTFLKDSVEWLPIRRWENAGKGSFTDFNACQNTVMDIKPMPDNSFIFAGFLPDFGRMKADGNLVFYKVAETYNFASYNKTHLKVNSTGNEISFKPVEKPTSYFSVKNKQLSTNMVGIQSLSGSTEMFRSITITDWRDSYTPRLNGKTLNFLNERERSRSVDISRDTNSIVFGADWEIYCLNAQGKIKWETFTQAEAWTVKISGDSRVVVTAMSDGTIRWYRMSDGALLLALFASPDNKLWILFTANGYYICSEGGDELIGWHINNGPDKAASFYPAKNYADQFFRPDIVSEILESCETDLEILKRKGEQTTDISKQPPLVKILLPGTNSESATSQVTITVDITDQGGGIDEVLLYLNGKLVETTQRSVTPVIQTNSKTTRSFNITLTTGENRVKATAFNNYRTEANADEISIMYHGVHATADLYLFLIGINEYKNPRYKLNYAVADATGIKTEMEKGGKDIFGNEKTILMQDADVTRKSVLQKFDELKSEVKQEDVFVFYYAGHGVMSEDKNAQYYIVPFDVTQLYNTNAEMKKVAISASELQAFSKDLKAQKQLFIFDACQSGGLVEELASHEASRGALEERAIAQLARSTGTYWIAASGSQQFASEFSTLGHGLFTYTILQGLEGGADGNNDHKITVEELSAYVKNKLPEFSEKYKGEVQYPNSFGYGMDFPIFILK